MFLCIFSFHFQRQFERFNIGLCVIASDQTCTGIRETDRMRDATTTWKTAIIHVQVLGLSLMLIPLASAAFCFERIQTNMLQVSGQRIHRMSDIIYIQHSSIDTGPLIQPNVVQCLLCGRLENDKRVYKQHFIRNHCTYGYHRQCKQCGQHFSDKIDLAHHNEDKNACPGQPLVYSRKTGDLYYRGSNASVMLSFPVYPRLCDNHFIGKCKQESTEECAVIETGGNSAEAEENTVETTEYQVSNVEGDIYFVRCLCVFYFCLFFLVPVCVHTFNIRM